jgi:hypothetical protein
LGGALARNRFKSKRLPLGIAMKIILVFEKAAPAFTPGRCDLAIYRAGLRRVSDFGHPARGGKQE